MNYVIGNIKCPSYTYVNLKCSTVMYVVNVMLWNVLHYKYCNVTQFRKLTDEHL